MARRAKQHLLPLHLGGNTSPEFPIFDDPAFMDNRAAPVHRWVPWIAGFSGAFVDSVLSSYLNSRRDSGIVLDPFKN